MRVVCLTLVVVCAAAFGQDPSVAVSPAPAGYKPKTDVALSPTATEAVRVSESFPTEANPHSPGPDGRDVYTFGAGLATLICAPLPICIIGQQADQDPNAEPPSVESL